MLWPFCLFQFFFHFSRSSMIATRSTTKKEREMQKLCRPHRYNFIFHPSATPNPPSIRGENMFSNIIFSIFHWFHHFFCNLQWLSFALNAVVNNASIVAFHFYRHRFPLSIYLWWNFWSKDKINWCWYRVMWMRIISDNLHFLHCIICLSCTITLDWKSFAWRCHYQQHTFWTINDIERVMASPSSVILIVKHWHQCPFQYSCSQPESSFSSWMHSVKQIASSMFLP